MKTTKKIPSETHIAPWGTFIHSSTVMSTMIAGIQAKPMPTRHQRSLDRWRRNGSMAGPVLSAGSSGACASSSEPQPAYRPMFSGF